MKKLTALVLAIIMCLTFMAPASAAAEEKELYPLVVVPGYSSSSMYKYNEAGEKEHVWGVDINEILGRVVARAVSLGIDIGALAAGDAKMLADDIGEEFVGLYGDMAYDENGKPVEQLYRYHKDAEDTSTAWLNENENGMHVHETTIIPYVTEYLGDKAEEWTFNFATDFRQNTVDCAKDLDVYIEDVLEYTGAKKVNIFAISHGGQTSANYLALYGHKQRVNNAVLTVPAIGGALLAYDILSDQIKFDEETLLQFIQNGFMLDEDIDWLMKAHALGFLDDFCHYLAPYLLDVLGKWGSIWDFVPAEHYEDIKKSSDMPESFLNSEVMAKSERFHKEILPNMSSLLHNTEALGTDIYIISGYGAPSVVGSQEESDAIISLNASSGSTCAPFGKRFNDGYKTLGTICNDPSHNHLSPKMNIDATTAYLPETTWMVDGLFHGMTLSDDFSKTLMKKLLESEERITVHTYAEYPQFHEATNVCESVYAEFDSSVPGYLDSNDTKLLIKNLSEKKSMQIASISVNGSDISFDAKDYLFKTLAPKETIEVPFSGNVPAESLTVAEVRISYVLVGSVTPVNEKDFYFTHLNGEAPAYDSENPYVDIESDGGFSEIVGDSEHVELFEKLGILEFLKVIFNIIMNLFGKYFMPFIK